VRISVRVEPNDSPAIRHAKPGGSSDDTSTIATDDEGELAGVSCQRDLLRHSTLGGEVRSDLMLELAW
jgi:hypothetical protein